MGARTTSWLLFYPLRCLAQFFVVCIQWIWIEWGATCRDPPLRRIRCLVQMALKTVYAHYLFDFWSASVIFLRVGSDFFPFWNDSFSTQPCSSEQVSWQGQSGLGRLPSLLCPGVLFLTRLKEVEHRVHICSSLEPLPKILIMKRGEVADIYLISGNFLAVYILPHLFFCHTEWCRYFSPSFTNGETEAQVNEISYSNSTVQQGLGPSFLRL